MEKLKLTSGMERRFVNPTVVELRAEDRDGKPVLTGYAARYESLSVPLNDGDGEFREVLAPGAFKRSLESDQDLVALAHHDSTMVLGRRSAKTLKAWEDDKGLRVEIIPPDTSLGRDIVELVRRGDLGAMSFGFEVVDDEVRSEGGEVIRTVKDLNLFEVSIVTWPAYPATSIHVRSDVPGRVKEAREVEAPPVVSIPILTLLRMQEHAERQ